MASPGLGTVARGYGAQHKAQRQRWAPLVDAGRVQCHAMVCLHLSRWIVPGSPWDLGHTEDRTGWTGPEHRTCNRAAGARKGNRRRAVVRLRRSRIW